MPIVEINLADILQYIGDRSRPLKEGEAVFKAGHIILCGMESNNSNVINSLCLQSSALTSPPHEIKIVLDDNVAKWICVCQCKAGNSGFCKHIIATLIYVNRNDDLDFISCTDITQKWGKEKKGLNDCYAARPFGEFCHPKVKKTHVFKVSKEIEQLNFDLLSTSKKDSSISTFLARSKVVTNTHSEVVELMQIHEDTYINQRDLIRNIFTHIESSTLLPEISKVIDPGRYDLHECCKKVLDQLQHSDVYAIATDTIQGSDIWKKERQLRITGSTCYSIYTFSKVEQWEIKSIKYFWPKGFSNKFTAHGVTYEKVALKLYEETYQCQVVTTSLIICKLFPWLAFSPDGIIFEDGFPTKLLEIKCPYAGTTNHSDAFADECDYLEVRDSIISLKKKHQYYGQVQLGMCILNVSETHLVIYSSFSNSFLNVIVKLDKQFVVNLFKKISNNYFQHMLHFYCLNKDKMN